MQCNAIRVVVSEVQGVSWTMTVGEKFKMSSSVVC